MLTHDTERTPLLAKSEANEDRPLTGREISPTTRYGILAGLWVGTFLCYINMTMVATLLPSITSEFNGSNQAGWIGTSYLLSSCTFTPLYGRLCTILGRRGACQTALFAATLGTFLCGISGGMVQLTVARFIAGVGGDALQLLTMIVTADMYNAKERGLPQAFISVFVGLGSGLGGPVGGILNDLFGWRVAFLCQVPFFILVTIAISNTLCYVTPGQSQSTKEVLSRIDFGGSISLFLTIGSSLVWLSMKFNEDLPWTDTKVILPLTLSVVFLILFLLIECLVAPEPVLPPSLMREKVPLLVGLSNYFVALCNFTIIYFVPMWFQTVPLDSASVAGLHLLPDSISLALGSAFAGWIMYRTGTYKIVNLVFGILPLCGILGLVFMREDSGWVQRWLSVVPIGFGNAVVFQTLLTALQSHLSEARMAYGTAFGHLFRSFGQTSGVAIASAVFQSRLDVELHRRVRVPNAEKMIAEIRHSMSLVYTLPGPLQLEVRNAYAASLKTVFVVAACSTLTAYIVRLPIPERPKKEAGCKVPEDVTSDSDVESVRARR